MVLAKLSRIISESMVIKDDVVWILSREKFSVDTFRYTFQYTLADI